MKSQKCDKTSKIVAYKNKTKSLEKLAPIDTYY